MSNQFLPVSRQDMLDRGLDQLDFVYVCGDAYVDHPSFGSAIISRILEAHGYTVGMICQPDWRDPESINIFGEPRLGFLVSSGNMDSMVLHYTVSKKRRHNDLYSPGGAGDRRPDRAVIVYCNLIRRTYKRTPIIIGGIEASLRRLGHYDYWSDSVRRSILLESGADLISYGMGEKSIVEIADALDGGIDVRDITYIEGTVYKTRDESSIYDAIRLPEFDRIRDKTYEGKTAYAKSYYLQYSNTDPYQAKRIYEPYGDGRKVKSSIKSGEGDSETGFTYVVQNPPAKPLTEMEMDDVYTLPYMRSWHPMYDAAGGIPAFGEIKFSLTSNRGCFGECNFCALTMHEGRIVQARSHDSILNEAKAMIQERDFKGYIHDVGGPTAEFRGPACAKQLKHGACKGKRCLWPEPCKNLKVDHADYVKLLRELRNLKGVKKVFVRSGVRFDYLMADSDKSFLRELCEHHVSGQLRVAPEHISDAVLKEMGKPRVSVYNSFVKEFERVNQKIGKEQYIVPYLMSSHPGSRLRDAIRLAEYVRDMGYMPEQVQDFYPTPGTVSTTMYYTGMNPLNMEPVYVAVDPHEKAMQRALIQYRDPKNYELVKEALLLEGREDLIGFEKKCLIPPRRINRSMSGSNKAGHSRSGHSKAELNKAGHSKAGHSKAGHSKAELNKAGHSKAGHSKAGHSKAEPGIDGHGKNGYGKAEFSKSGHGKNRSSNAGQRKSVQNNTGSYKKSHKSGNRKGNTQ